MSAKRAGYHAEIVSAGKAKWKARRAFATLQEAVAAVVAQAEKKTGAKSPYTRHWVTEAREHMVDFGSHTLFGRVTCDDPKADLGLPATQPGSDAAPAKGQTQATRTDTVEQAGPAKPAEPTDQASQTSPVDPLDPELIPLPDGAELRLTLSPFPETDSDGRWPFTVAVPGKGMPAFVVRAKTAESALATLSGILYDALDRYEGDGDVTADD